MLAPDYESYFDHALSLNDAELELRDQLLDEVPDSIIDSHVHAAHSDHIDTSAIPQHVFSHMMSTYPVTTIEQSRQISELMMPGKEVRKLRFAHVFPGIGHNAVNRYLLDESPEGDRTALFGLSDTPDDVEHTAEQLRNGLYAGLKMYYISSDPPKYDLFDYFPPPILEAAEQEDVPIILHLPHSLYRSDKEVVSLAQRYPDLKIVLAHVGVAHIPKAELDGVLSSFGAFPNIFADTARVHSAEIVAAALRHLGSDRVMYGSDEPLNMLRSVPYFNPDLNSPRILTDFDYHWADAEEQAKWRHLAPRFVHSQWEQLEAIASAFDLLELTPAERQATAEKVFHDNAQGLFDFE